MKSQKKILQNIAKLKMKIVTDFPMSSCFSNINIYNRGRFLNTRKNKEVHKSLHEKAIENRDTFSLIFPLCMKTIQPRRFAETRGMNSEKAKVTRYPLQN